ncbi:MAG TPA: DUF4337 family protein [Verrucomicrobiae bacterium]
MAGKIQIPEELKKDLPQNNWGKILGATPIVMTVVATMLAGLASSEMTKAQYNRSFAAQLQSKAGDQWNYFQAKKLRSAVAHNSLDLLMATTEVKPLDAAILGTVDPAISAALTKTQLPAATPATFPENIATALAALDAGKPDEEVNSLVNVIPQPALDKALVDAREAANKFDDVAKPINKASDKMDEQLMTGDKEIFRSFSAARLRLTSARYDAEAKLNAAIGGVYELQVRKYNLLAERHHRRSTRFFMGMLAAQFGVIVATFSIAAQKKSLLWSLAATAGAIAVSFSLYVYLYI